MKKFTKFLSVFMTAIMTLGMLIPNMAFAADATKTNTVWVHKILMADLGQWEQNPEGYDGTQTIDWIKDHAAVKDIKELKDVYFAVQNAAGQFIDKEGNELGDDLKTMSKENFAKVLGGKTTATGLSLDTSKLPQSEPTQYKIVENLELSTYVGDKGETLTGSHQHTAPILLTLPLVNDDGVQPEVHLYPKNTEDKPEIDKNYVNGTETDANDDANKEDIASPGAQYPNYDKDKNTITRQIGDVVPYDVKTKIPADVHYKTLRWEDTMSKGLTYNMGSLVVKDITDDYVFVGGVENDKKIKDYIIKENQSGFVIEFTEQGLANIEKITKGKAIEIQLTYDATINTEVEVDKVDENEIIFNYSNNPKEFNEPRENEVKPFENKIKVEKSWDEGTAPTGIEVTYYLYEKGATAAEDKVVAMVVKDNETGFDHIFTSKTNVSLDSNKATYYEFEDGKTYYVKETVSRGFSYDPAYDVTAGTVKIKNTKDTVNPKPLVPTHPKVVTHGKKFVKTNNASTPERLAGAEFVITNAKGDKYLTVKSNDRVVADALVVKTAKLQLDNAIIEYNRMNEMYVNAKAAYDNIEVKGKGTEAELKAMKKAELAMQAAKSTVDAKQIAYNEAFIAARTKYEWIAAATPEAAIEAGAYVLVSDANGQFEITGLDAGNYNLVETKAPAGYALNTAKVPFSVGMGSYGAGSGNIDYIKADDDAKNDDALQVENKKISIPQTGGIGTAIFIIAGIALMGGAFVAMKRQEA